MRTTLAKTSSGHLTPTTVAPLTSGWWTKSSWYTYCVFVKGVYAGTSCYIQWYTRGEAWLGLQNVWCWWKRIHWFQWNEKVCPDHRSGNNFQKDRNVLSLELCLQFMRWWEQRPATSWKPRSSLERWTRTVMDLLARLVIILMVLCPPGIMFSGWIHCCMLQGWWFPENPSGWIIIAFLDICKDKSSLKTIYIYCL